MTREKPLARKGRRRKMTPGWVDVVKPEARPVEWRDTVQPGLVLRVEVSGRKTWVLRYVFAGRDRRFRLGAWPSTSLKAARTSASRQIGLKDSGTDPQVMVERLRAGQTVYAVIEAWLSDKHSGPAGRWKGGLTWASTARAYLSAIRRFQKRFERKKLVEVTTLDVERFVDAANTPATRNRSLTALRMLFSWCVRKGLVQADPTVLVDKEHEVPRQRTLTDDELRALLHGFDGHRYGRVVRLLALTALRREEVLAARWSWLDSNDGVLSIPPEAEKSGKVRGEKRLVALSPQAVALLAEQREAQFRAGVRSEFIFSDDAKDGAKPHSAALQIRLNVLRRQSKGTPAVLPADVRLHDVRRTVANSLLNRLAANAWTVDHVVLGHTRPKLLRTYMPNLPLAEARADLTRWADLLDRILEAQAKPSRA